MEVSKLSGYSEQKNSEKYHQRDKTDVTMRFHQTLQELRDFRSQLHDAADYCESTFLNTKKKNIAVENTKEYICRAVVALVDHLGCVSNNLNSTIAKTNGFSDAELRINCLKQRLLSCDQYVQKFATKRVQFTPNFPKFHSRYLSTSNASAEKSNQDERTCQSTPAKSAITDKNGVNTEDLPLFLYTQAQRSSSLKSGEVLPVRDGISILTKCPTSTFHFQTQHCSPRRRRSISLRKYVNSNEILSVIRRTKRATWV